ncbi:unannotated protein [freshwater metagenome]|uniref:Unannotated protein n=1 Tax=freshwater metagenome TaxID=449393 RepID=A0A6J6W7U3_9ZZZZ
MRNKSPGLSWLLTSKTVESTDAWRKTSTSGAGTGIVGNCAYERALSLMRFPKSTPPRKASSISRCSFSAVGIGAFGSRSTIHFITADEPCDLVRAERTSNLAKLRTPATIDNKPG